MMSKPMTTSIKEALKPCPFCGGEPDIRTRMDEDIWTHNTVEWTGVHCAECGIGFEWPPGAEPDAAEQWNTRATFQPDGERREAIARLIDPRSHQKYDDAYRRKDRHDQMVWIGGVNKAREKADHIIAILASGLVRDEAGWRDSGTIPMDGTNVLIAEDHRGSSGEAYYDAEEGRWYWANTGRGDYPTPPEPFPTHWKPLPAPPPIRSARDGGEK